MKQYYKIGLIIILALFLRIYNTWERPYFTDEAWYCFMVKGYENQEFVPQAISKIIGTPNEFIARLPFVLCGTLTVLFAYLILPKWSRLKIALLIAVCPLFVMWSSVARPYAYAGLFIVLAWRYKWFFIPALATTPIALIGIGKEWIKHEGLSLLALFLAIVFFLIRPDSGRNFWTLEQFAYRTAWWYLPTLSLLMWIGQSEKCEKLYNDNISFILNGICFIFLLLSLAYMQVDKGMVRYTELAFSDFRGVPHTDYSTNAIVHNWYCGSSDIRYFRTTDTSWRARESFTVSSDYYALTGISRDLFPQAWHEKNDVILLNGGVLVNAFRQQNKKPIGQ